ncbi:MULTISPECIES: helix-turn-helix domain-containing protein [Vreelandella]|jgi:transcriptional regulator with XRE-family HTH domain|uniref:Helix-turn-helix transcriptional regulator n=1 Tax=Vreelandella salicampi TaxID=1449798 RepID=A0A7Z0RVQ2_9GAMM|nr:MULTISPECIES: helix-turn-helix transcriptional regulator [Halomonas]MCD1651794.1 helix-turn-helix transcriptional regulator [Halomonas axialensis]MCD2088613.1 helix-turn-helix transcriptional regulator [Halomonas meridiana]NYS61971.1 helix-turn-helix transcriptional regulator [Halomonas salicampi]|tara:strand:- start:415 stop:702 length:288 start_codon:yes stop_codon:yes gene_type:complete
MNVGYAIKLCRQQRKLTQGELAKRAGVSISYLSLLERGERSDPGLSALEKIAKGLNVPMTLLLFLAADEDELSGFTPDLKEKLSAAALNLMRESA